MRLLLSGVLALGALVLVGVHAFADPPPASGIFDSSRGLVLQRFRSAEAFQRFLRQREARQPVVMFEVQNNAPPPVALPSIDFQSAQEPASANPEITNNQTVGVDEGGIVKQIGRFLVILQDGRLFSADIGADEGAPLRLADRMDVYRRPETAAEWYDEMLVLGDRVLVTAYSYREQASEISVFRMDAAGRLTREGRFLVSSNDYYSTENYATRLIGDTLVLYAPVSLETFGEGQGLRWPRLRRADGDAEADEGDALIGPTDIYAPLGEVEWPVLHVVSICPLREQLDCRTTAFVGPAMREFYVSPTDIFLWIGAPDGLPWSIDYGNRRRRQCPQDQYLAEADHNALLYRIPVDGGAIGAIAVDGIPADQFAFESRDGRFRALLSKAQTGCFPAEPAASLALLDIPLSAFDGRVRHVAGGAYTSLPAIGPVMLENRFIGDWLVYGGSSGGLPDPAEGRANEASLVAVPLARPTDPIRLNVPHGALRIERAGRDAVVTGYRDQGGLSISYVALDGRRPRLAATATLPGRFESEGRSHAFNAWIRRDGSGVIGIPTSQREWRAGRGWSDSESSDLSFVAVSPDKALAPAGELRPRPRRPRLDASAGYACQVSCIDWYGNSRPIFTGGRLFALMGTDLVEGRLAEGRMGELSRLDLTGTERLAHRGGPAEAAN